MTKINFNDQFLFFAKTDEELSLACSSEYTPSNATEREDGWCGLRVQGVLDFSLVGILARISSILASAEISIFAISTFNTDYILIKESTLDKALSILESNGYCIIH